MRTRMGKSWTPFFILASYFDLFCGFLMSHVIPKVSIADKMRCSLRVQCHIDTLFNPVKVDWSTNIYGWFSSKPDLTCSCYTQPFLSGGWKIYKLQNVGYAIARFHGRLWFLYLLYNPCGILSYFTSYRTQLSTTRWKPSMILTMCGVSKLPLRPCGQSIWTYNTPDPPLHQDT